MSAVTWTKEQNKMRSQSLRGRKLSDETRAAMHASRIIGRERVDTPEWQKAFDGFMRLVRIRERIADGLETGELDHRRLDADDPRWKPFTTTIRVIDRTKLVKAIRSQRLDEYLGDIAAEYAIDVS